jgi:hypothetical protein
VFPDLRSSKYDIWTPLPEYSEQNSTDFNFESPDGFPLLHSERTAVHASSSITDVTERIDDEEIHRNVSPQDYITELQDSVGYTALSGASAINIYDTDTLFYFLRPDMQAAELLSGRARFQNVTKQLSTYQHTLVYVPIIGEDEIKRELEWVTGNVRRKTLRAASLFHVQPVPGLPKRLQFALPWALVDEQDKEFQQFPGWVAAAGGRAAAYFPEHVTQAARSQKAAAEAAGKPLAAETPVEELALAIPGAVNSGRGLAKSNSTALALARQQVAK